MYNLILYGISTWTIRYQLILQSKVESSSGQTECFSLPIHSDSCNMGLRLCDSSIIAEILRLTAAKLLRECDAAFKSARADLNAARQFGGRQSMDDCNNQQSHITIILYCMTHCELAGRNILSDWNSTRSCRLQNELVLYSPCTDTV